MGLTEGRSEAVEPSPHELASVELMEHPEHHQRCLGVCKMSGESQGGCQDKGEGGGGTECL